MLVRFKRGVEAEGVAREVWFALGVMSAIHWQMFGKVLVVTSLRDGAHGAHSLHGSGLAGDVRTRDLAECDRVKFHRVCRDALFGHGFDVVCEGPPWNERAPHEHCEFDPKEGRAFLIWEEDG